MSLHFIQNGEGLVLFLFLREISQLAISSKHNYKAKNWDGHLWYSALHTMERAIRWRILIFTQWEWAVLFIYSLCISMCCSSVLCYLNFNSSRPLFPSKQFNLLADGEAEKGKRDLLLSVLAPACFHLQGTLFHAYSPMSLSIISSFLQNVLSSLTRRA